MSESSVKDLSGFSFAIAILSVVFMLVLSAIGSTVGAAKAAASAAIVANRGVDLITKSFLPILLASSGFIYAIIYTFLVLPKLEETIAYDKMWQIVAGCTVFGVGSLFAGLAIGEVNKNGIVLLSENRKIFLSLAIINSAIEMTTVFALICATMVI